ncbi:ABC transporter permease [Methanocaldococcus sp.]
MYIKLALRNLSRHKIRSFLALLGIVIGVATITTLGILGCGVKAAIEHNFKDVANTIILFPNYVNGYTYFTKEDVNKLRIANSITIPIYQVFSVVKVNHRLVNARIFGVKEDEVKYLNKNIRYSSTGVCIDSYFQQLVDAKVNDKIVIKNQSFKILSVVNGSYLIPSNTIIMASSKFYNLFKPKGYGRIYIYVIDPKDIEEVKKEVENRIDKREKKAIIIVMSEIIKKINEALSKISIFVIGIGAISLFVAGLGIGNVMLMSVIERTNEIGVMRSIGASKKDILIIFITEALILGLVGAFIGVILSIVFSLFILSLMKVSFPLTSIIYIVAGFLFGILTALLSSLYPAYKASKLDPIEALRR